MLPIIRMLNFISLWTIYQSEYGVTSAAEQIKIIWTNMAMFCNTKYQSKT
jgi:hypothetical protein